MSKRILVTGGAGFIGSHLCKRLVKQGHKVLCLDNLYTGFKSNVAELLNTPFFEFIEHDVTEPLDLAVDQIYNLACPASPEHYQRNPLNTLKTSVFGLNNMLELAQANGAKILHTSTSEVYGDPLVHPQPESYWGNVNPIGRRACYDESKRCAETLCFDYQREFGLDIKVVRIFNTYGPNMDPNDGRVVSNFIVQALRNQDITVYGTGNQTRSFCYIDDLVDGLIAMMETERGFNGPVNLGNPSEFTILQLAEKVLALTASNSKLIFQKLPADDPRQRQPDITLAMSKLGWQPRITLDDGLKATINYFKDTI
ncbi:MAG: SDR family oxidoreductase [Veillonellaceae bacterium]|nr:SDR family oxidoreductase [Veillonellaceae bacterium]